MEGRKKGDGGKENTLHFLLQREKQETITMQFH